MPGAFGNIRRKLIALLAVPLLLGSGAAAAPRPERPRAEALLVWYTERFYSDATYSVLVGRAYATCDGDYVITEGYATSYSIITYKTTCP